MKDNKVTIQLTNEQQKQIKDKTGKNIRNLNIDLAMGDLTEKQLDAVSGGNSIFEWRQKVIDGSLD
jgi:hypothetical protein